MQTCNALVIGKVFQYRHNVFAYNANLDPGFIYNTTVALSDLAVTQDYYTNITAKYMPGQSCMVWDVVLLSRVLNWCLLAFYLYSTNFQRAFHSSKYD